MKLKNRME